MGLTPAVEELDGNRRTMGVDSIDESEAGNQLVTIDANFVGEPFAVLANIRGLNNISPTPPRAHATK